ncbi:MAG: hypothetical protein ACRCTQ_06300 [Brevinemataceae bacterium]
MKKNPTLYLELLFPNKSKEMVWKELFSHKQIKHLFSYENQISFTEDQHGQMCWKIYFFKSIKGKYSVIAYQENSHLLVDIASRNFQSTILLTLVENTAGTILRLDQRSFNGRLKNAHIRSFERFWKKLFDSLAKLNK